MGHPREGCGKVPGKSYEVEIAINEASKDFEIGKKVSFMALVDDQHSRYGSKTVVYPVGARPPQESDRAAAAERIKAANSAAYMQQAEKWLGYIKENLSKYWYKRGEEEVRAVAKKMEAAGLDPKDLLAKLSSLQEKWKGISTSESTLKKEANRWLGFIEDSLAQYWYKKGESEVRGIIKKMEAAGYDASETQKKLSDLQAKWDKKTGKKSTDGALAPGEVYLSAGSGNGGERFHVGDVIKNPHSGGATYLKILSEKSKYYAEDGLSFGVGDDSGYIYTATARPATDEESAPLREEEQAAAEQRAYKEKLQEIARDIREHGERPENAKPEGEKVYLSEQDERSVIYGGGQWLVVGSEWIWFVQNNGMDGDNWGANNIGGTGGSGAIGWRVPTTPELVDSIGVQPPVVKKRQW